MLEDFVDVQANSQGVTEDEQEDDLGEEVGHDDLMSVTMINLFSIDRL